MPVPNSWFDKVHLRYWWFESILLQQRVTSELLRLAVKCRSHFDPIFLAICSVDQQLGLLTKRFGFIVRDGGGKDVFKTPIALPSQCGLIETLPMA